MKQWFTEDEREQVSRIVDMVSLFFHDEPWKTTAWLDAPNPLLGNVSPRDMVLWGRVDRLEQFVRNAMDENYRGAN
jgi:uncharacterized protein (DUF2384 family)